MWGLGMGMRWAARAHDGHGCGIRTWGHWRWMRCGLESWDAVWDNVQKLRPKVLSVRTSER
jgi:hypothetical protein